MNKVSLRFHNDTYAPGIATYGIDGKAGQQGTPGVSMFFTDYSLPDELELFIQKITSRLLPLKNEEVVLNRIYVTGDTFVCRDGKIYMINIDNVNKKLCNDTNITDNDIISYIGSFDKTKEESLFTSTDGLLSRGKKLTLSDTNKTTSGTGILNIIKTTDSNKTVDFINLQALYGSNPDINLDIKYDNQYKSFVLNSNYPIVIDGNLFVKPTTQKLATLTNQYSPVLTRENSITDFISSCNDLTYNVDASIYNYTMKDSSTIYYGSVYKITLNDDKKVLDDLNTFTIHFQNKEFQDFLLYRLNETTYFFKQEYNNPKLNEVINKVAYTDINNLQISVINNIEVYLKMDSSNISGFETDNDNTNS